MSVALSGRPEYRERAGACIVVENGKRLFGSLSSTLVRIRSRRGLLSDTGAWLAAGEPGEMLVLEILPDAASEDVIFSLPPDVAAGLRPGLRCTLECTDNDAVIEFLWRDVSRGREVTSPSKSSTTKEKVPLSASGGLAEQGKDEAEVASGKGSAAETEQTAGLSGKPGPSKVLMLGIAGGVAIAASGAVIAYPYAKNALLGPDIPALDCAKYSASAPKVGFDQIRVEWFTKHGKPEMWSGLLENFDSFACQGATERQQLAEYVQRLAKNTDVSLAKDLSGRY